MLFLRSCSVWPSELKFSFRYIFVRFDDPRKNKSISVFASRKLIKSGGVQNLEFTSTPTTVIAQHLTQLMPSLFGVNCRITLGFIPGSLFLILSIMVKSSIRWSTQTKSVKILLVNIVFTYELHRILIGVLTTSYSPLIFMKINVHINRRSSLVIMLWTNQPDAKLTYMLVW